MLTSAGGYSLKEYLDTKDASSPVPVVPMPQFESLPKLGAPAPENSKAKLHGLPASVHVMPPMLFAMHAMGDKVEFSQCNILEGAHNTPEYGAINPFRQIPAFTDVDGTSMGESNAIILYIASKYAPQYLMSDKPTAMWALEAAGSYVYSGGWRGVCYPVLEYVPPPADGDFKPEVEKLYKNLATYEAAFLSGKFIGGDSLCVADFKLAPLVECMIHPAVKAQTGFECPARYVTWLEDFKAASPGSAMLTSAGGKSLKEYLDTKVKDDRACGRMC
jgi:glutathione S-transferase